MIAVSIAGRNFDGSALNGSTQLPQQSRISRPSLRGFALSSITKITASLVSGLPETGHVASGYGDPFAVGALLEAPSDAPTTSVRMAVAQRVILDFILFIRVVPSGGDVA